MYIYIYILCIYYIYIYTYIYSHDNHDNRIGGFARSRSNALLFRVVDWIHRLHGVASTVLGSQSASTCRGKGWEHAKQSISKHDASMIHGFMSCIFYYYYVFECELNDGNCKLWRKTFEETSHNETMVSHFKSIEETSCKLPLTQSATSKRDVPRSYGLQKAGDGNHSMRPGAWTFLDQPSGYVKMVMKNL